MQINRKRYIVIGMSLYKPVNVIKIQNAFMLIWQSGRGRVVLSSST